MDRKLRRLVQEAESRHGCERESLRVKHDDRMGNGVRAVGREGHGGDTASCSMDDGATTSGVDGAWCE